MTTATLTVRESMGAREVNLGCFYLGGSFPRQRILNVYQDGMLTLTAYDVAGSFHSTTANVAGELRYIDESIDRDDPDRLRDHHAFAAAIREALRLLGVADPTA